MTLAIVLLTLAAIFAALVVFLRRGSRRQRVMVQVLDSADALEARLREARAEIEAIAGSEDNLARFLACTPSEIAMMKSWLVARGK